MANEHDIRYKKLFSNPILVQELLQYFVKEDFIQELDFNTLERLDKSFITDRFKEKESDLIYKINFKGKALYIYLIIEFQSTVDRFMSLRVLRYICEFYEFLVQQKVKELPPVFPVVLYNGDGKWNAPLNIKDLICNTIPEKYIPEFRFYPVLENEISKNTLLTIKNAVSVIFYVENSEFHEVKKNIDKIIYLLQTEKPEIITLFRNWINNLLGFNDTAINSSIIELEETREMFATSIKKHDKKLRDESMKKGIEKGIEKGIKQEKEKMIIRLNQAGISVEMISETSELSINEVNLIIKKHKNK